MYRYYSTKRPVAPGTYPGSPADIHSYGQNGADFPTIGKVWGYLEYEEPLTPQQVSDYELTLGAAPASYYPINEETARRAKEMNSFSDYCPGSATDSYRRQADKAAYLALRCKNGTDPMYHERIDELLETYCRKLAANLNEGYAIETRCPSVMIAGPANFPTRKKEKQNAARDSNMEEYKHIQGLLDKIKSAGMGGISSDDPNAIDKLKEKLVRLESDQQTMKDANTYYRKNKTLDGCPGITPKVSEWLNRAGVFNCGERGTPLEAQGRPFATYSLSNNNANIKRIRDRIAELEKRATATPAGWEFDGGEVVMNTEANRIQILFEDKPDADLRAELKAAAFKWAPSQGAWQRQLTNNALWAAKQIKAIQPTAKGE